MDSTGQQGRDLDASALRALAHPLRIKILDMLGALGPQTASTLGARLGESSGSTSYHLRALAKHDLIEEDPERGTGRERWWKSTGDKLVLGSEEATRTPAGRAASQLVAAEMYRLYEANLQRYLGSRESAEDEASMVLSKANLTAEQYASFAGRIIAILDEAVQASTPRDTPGARTYSMRLDMFPLTPANALADVEAQIDEGDRP